VTNSRLAPLFFACLLGAASSTAQQITLPLWSHGAPESRAFTAHEHDITAPSDPLIAGRKIIKLTDVSTPTLALYKPGAGNSGAAVLVFPGGGYSILAYDLEGTEVCAWLNSIHVTCVLVKYRVPYTGHYPERPEDLEDAQQAMRLTRIHAAEWGIDPNRIGVLGFSAGAHLAVVLSNHFDFAPTSNAVKEHGGLDASISARPDFALIIYPAYLVHWPDAKTLAPEAVPSAATPPTFLLQAEDDPVHEENALVYFQTLKDTKVPAELHIYSHGGHGYGLRQTDLSITHWPSLAETWLHTIHVLN
jgi:acetyl esterase/lipase